MGLWIRVGAGAIVSGGLAAAGVSGHSLALIVAAAAFQVFVVFTHPKFL